jgi:hypothetical protein
MIKNNTYKMKTNTKKILLGLGVALLGSFGAQAQGLQGIQVEQFYRADANDIANSVAQGAVDPLTVNSITYRVYVDMAPGYVYNTAFGDANHAWKITTTTNFYNDPNNGIAGTNMGNTSTAGTTANYRKNTVAIDSWLGTGPVGTGKIGVPEVEDTDGSLGNAQLILANNPGGVFGLPISTGAASSATTVADGLINGVFVGGNISALGLGGQEAIFDQTSGTTFSVNGGSFGYLGGLAGSPSTNKVLIGQFTTDGVLGFELNVQITNTVTLVSELWVANNVQPGEFTLPGLTLVPPVPPTVSVTGPSNLITGTSASFVATAADADGTVSTVQFQVNGVNLGSAISGTTGASTNYTSTVFTPTVPGVYTITAIAIDNAANSTTSSNFIVTVGANQAPVVTVSAPSGIVAPAVVTFSANANDPDGTVSSVTFSVNGVAIGTDLTAPYTMTWTSVAGLNQNVTASAIDNLGLVGTSAPAIFNVVANQPPVVTITAPLNNSSVIAPQVVTITATATDADGTVASVSAFVNNVLVGTLTSGGPNYTFTYATSTLTSVDVIRVVATDNAASSTTSTPVSVNVANPFALPYVIGGVKQECDESNFCLPINAAITYSVNDVIGYDLVLNYDATKVTPTGSITVFSDLINPAFVSVINDYTTTPGTMLISASILGSAPPTAEWNGNGRLFCVEMNKIGSNFSATETTTFATSFLQESYFTGVTPKLASNGFYQAFKDSLFDAKLKFWADGSALGYTNAAQGLITNIYGTDPACAVNNTNIAVNPNTLGEFTYNILNGNSIYIKRDIANSTNVLLAIGNNDQTLARRVLLNQASLFTPNVYQMIALDVNMDGVVSAGDLTQIQQRTVLQIGEFKQTWNYNAAGTKTLTGFNSESKDWQYVDSTTVLTNPAYAISATYPANDLVGFSKAKVPVVPFCQVVPQASLTANCPSINNAVYRGIMVGDADGNFSVLSSTLQFRPSGDNKVVVDLGNAIVNGNAIDVPVSFVSSEPVYGLDLQMNFDESNMTFNSMVNYPSTTDLLAYFNTNDRALRLTSGNVYADVLPAGQPVASIRFETKNGVIDADQFNSLLGVLNGNQVAVEVVSKTVGINALSSDNSVSIFPNPTNGILNITSVSDATVELFDVTGKQVLLTTTVSASKTQQVNISGLVEGVYILKVSNNDFVSIKKVVLTK